MENRPSSIKGWTLGYVIIFIAPLSYHSMVLSFSPAAT